MGIVYKATNKIDGTSYIGATRHTLAWRKSMHKQEARRDTRGSSLFWRAVREHGVDMFEWSVLRTVTDDQLREAEIAEITNARQRGEHLYNVSGGPGSLGRQQPAEVRAKISASLKGRPAPKKQKPVYQGKSYNEWAAELGITYNAVWRRIQNNGTPFQLKEQQNVRPKQ